LFNKKKALIGFSGSVGDWGTAVQWFTTMEGKPPRLRNLEMLALVEGGKLYHSTQCHSWLRLHDSHAAIGSGMTFAVAAMQAGSTPQEAVKIASKYDLGTGSGVKSINLKD
jgi:ATP-dependent protease HslVU (ClpYQ) peptidase subunit